jgi:hypothetical protein
MGQLSFMASRSILAMLIALLLTATAAQAERAKSRGDRPEARDSAAIQDYYHQGTIASLMSAFCNNRETARRALFLLGFLSDAEGR